MSTQIQIAKAEQVKPTYQEVEQALIKVVKAGIHYKKPKDGKFMQSYKRRILGLRQAEDPDKYVLENAKRLFPDEYKYRQIIDDYKSWYRQDPKILNAIMDLYKLYYKLVKDSFSTDEQEDKKQKTSLCREHPLGWQLSV